MNTRHFLLSLAVAGIGLTGMSGAALADLAVHDAYSFATIKGAKAGAVFMRIESDVADRLVGVESAASPRPELHTHLHENGVMKMRKVDGFDVGPEAELVLKPAGNHVMLMDLPAALVQGETVALTLIFEKAGRVDVTAPIRAAGQPWQGDAATHGKGKGWGGSAHTHAH